MSLSQTPKISFILPVYNVESYLAQCVESILQQDVDKEIILVNDGSTDESLKIALNYANRYDFIVVIHAQNGGASTARNRGLRIAKGEFVLFVDSDDYLMPCNFNELCLLANENNVDFIRFSGKEISIEGNSKNIPMIFEHTEKNIGTIDNVHNFFKLMAYKGFNPSVCITLIRRHFLIHNSLFFVENNSVEDAFFYFQILTYVKNSKIMEFNWDVYRYRRNANSVTNTFTEKFLLDHFDIINLIKTYQEEMNFDKEINLYINLVIARLYRNALSVYFQLEFELKIKLAYLFNLQVQTILKTHFNDLNEILDTYFLIEKND